MLCFLHLCLYLVFCPEPLYLTHFLELRCPALDLINLLDPINLEREIVIVLLLWLHILLRCLPFSKLWGPVDMQLEWQGQPLSLLCRTQPVFPSSCSLFQPTMRVSYFHLWNTALFSQTFSSSVCHSKLLPPPSYWQKCSRWPVLEIIFPPSFHSFLWWWWSWCSFLAALFKILKLGMKPFIFFGIHTLFSF